MAKTVRSFDPRQVMGRPDFEIFHYRDQHLHDVPLHHHDFYEVYYFLDGRVDYLVEGRTYSLRPEDVLLISPMELHRPAASPEKTCERVVLWIGADYLNELPAEEGVAETCFGTGRNLFHSGGTEVGPLMLQLAREADSGRPGGPLYARGLFLQLMAELLRLCAGSRRSAASQETDPLVDQALEYIAGHYREDLNLEKVADRFFVNKYHLEHRFSLATGVGVYRYILLKRLQHARQMLAEGSSAGEACRACGFRDYANFYRAFRSNYGVSPQMASASSLRNL